MPRKRQNRVTICMDDDEFDKYNKLLKKSKLSNQDYGLKCLLNKNVVVVDGIINLAYEIRKIGVNINQVVHLANAEHSANQEDIKKLENMSEDVWKLLNEFVKSVNK